MSPSFTVSKINQLRNLAMEFGRLPEIFNDGWSKSPVNPIQLLNAFPSLRLRKGFVLRGYVYRAGGNGNGIIWAVPADSAFLEPEDCIKLEGYFLSPPKPPDALDDYMEAIDGDGTPWSYLSASIFKREAQEFGALWHGCSWSDQRILGKNPISPNNKAGTNVFSHQDPDYWVWEAEWPTLWKPAVVESGDYVNVIFYVHNIVGGETITQKTDTFVKGQYKFETTSRTIASGPGGIIY